MKDVGEFRLAVSCPGVAFFLVDIREIYPFLWGEVIGSARYVNDSYISWLRDSCGREEERE